MGITNMIRKTMTLALLVLLAGCTAPGNTAIPKRKAPPLPPMPPGMKIQKMSSARTVSSVVVPPDSRFHSAARFGDVANDSGASVAVDRVGNVFIGGVVQVNTGSPHPFLMKRSPSGVVVWSNTFPGNMTGSINALGVDTSGNVLAIGTFYTGIGATWDVGGIQLVSSNSSWDIFVLKLAADGGRALWAKRFGSPQIGHPPNESGNGLVVDTNDNSVVITGIYGSDGIDFGGGLVPASSGQNLFLVKLSMSDGSLKWVRVVPTQSFTKGSAVAVDATGNIFLTGNIDILTGSTIDFGGGATPVTGSGMFVAKYTTDNRYVWSKQFGMLAEGRALALDQSGNVVVTGKYYLTINFGGQTFTNLPSGSPFAMPSSTFVANFSAANGTHIWSKRMSGGIAAGVAVGPSGNIMFTSAGPLIVNLAPDGTERWSKYFAGSSQCSSVATDANGRSYVTGKFFGTVDFGGGPVASAGSSDIFLVELGAPAPVVVAPTGDMAISELYPDPEFGSFYIVSGIQKANHTIKFYAQDRVGGPSLLIGTWGTSPIEQRVGVSVQAGLPLRWVYSANEPAGFAPASVAPQAPLVNTGKQTKVGGTNFNVFRSGKMYIFKP